MTVLKNHSHTWAHATFTGCGYYSRVATIQGWSLFEGGHYSRVVTIQGWSLFKGGHYSRVATIQGWSLIEGGHYSRVPTIRGRRPFEVIQYLSVVIASDTNMYSDTLEVPDREW